ncbi:MAG: hypothetical protein A2X67_02050 [Ignavibacteria bacterium GWA2_55_11]|nr:MAG: hypothetical protein A2X67_02050 [Ignavibacteria bacterium GWA2_55_11]
MNAPTPTQTRQRSYFVDNVQFPFCKGCGHTQVLRRLDEALSALNTPAEQIALVTDIGCIGLADGLFRDIHTVHTTHGRSTAFATGIGLADRVLAGKDLRVVVLIGDGGAMIGLQHLVHAAMLNVPMTVLICNNFVYGMTGGQGSGLTPERFITATTPDGNITPPADLCAILTGSNAQFVARTTTSDTNFPDIMRRAFASPGFAAVEILELCTEYAVPKNELTGKMLASIAEQNGWALGVLRENASRAPFHVRYAEAVRTSATPKVREHGFSSAPHAHQLAGPVSIVLAGSAGERVQSSAAALCEAAIASGLYVTQKNDNPVTQGSGFSLSEVWISPEPIQYTGIERPDIVVAASEAGLRELTSRGTMASVSDDTVFVVDESLAVSMRTRKLLPLSLRKSLGPKDAALGGLLAACHEKNVLPDETLALIARYRMGDRAKVCEGMVFSV